VAQDRVLECIQRSMRCVDYALCEIHVCTFGVGEHLRLDLVHDVALSNMVIVPFQVKDGNHC